MTAVQLRLVAYGFLVGCIYLFPLVWLPMVGSLKEHESPVLAWFLGASIYVLGHLISMGIC